jgi:predicted ATPase
MPYRLWIEVVRQAMAQGAFPYQEMSQHPRLYQPLSTLLAELAEMPPQDAAASPAVLEQGQLRLWEAMLALLGAISRRTALLLVLDDLHWTDASSQQLLTYLARRLHSYPILLLGTYRENEVLATHPLRLLLTMLQREQVITMLTVPPLADSYIGTLLSHLPRPLAQRIQRQAAGNPFFAEELAQAASTEEHLTQALPATITAVLDLRLGMLSHACQQLLGKAAVLGNSFSFQQISMLEASDPTSLEEERVLTLLEEALRGGILSEEGTGTHITYIFWHPLLVNHLYERVSASRRTRLHLRVAEVLQQVYRSREDELAAAITHHLVQGGADPLQIVHYAEIAADRAYTLSAYPEAEKYYRIAIEHLEETLHQLTRTSADERIHLAYLLERLGECTRVQGNYEEARHFYERVLEVRSHQRIFASYDEYQQEAQIDALLWREIALTWYDIGDTAHAQQCCEGGEQVLREAGVIGGPAWAILRFEQGYIYWREGKYEAARLSALDALKLFNEALQQHDHPDGNISRVTATRRTLAGNAIQIRREGHFCERIRASEPFFSQQKGPSYVF